MASKREQAEDWTGRTIVGVPVETASQLTSLLSPRPEQPHVKDVRVERKLFKVRMADSEGRRSSASLLINKMYSWRGYEANTQLHENPNRITLMASDEDATIATISIGFDSHVGLLADDLYKAEIDTLRAEGRRICEFTKLAIDNAVRSKRVLGAVFHIACIYSHRIQRFTDLVIEINPRHVKFYERMLGFIHAGPQRLNLRVNAPAILMRLEFAYVRSQVAKLGGRGESAKDERSLYPYFFSAAEESGIAGRLITLQ